MELKVEDTELAMASARSEAIPASNWSTREAVKVSCNWSGLPFTAGGKGLLATLGLSSLTAIALGMSSTTGVEISSSSVAGGSDFVGVDSLLLGSRTRAEILTPGVILELRGLFDVDLGRSFFPFFSLRTTIPVPWATALNFPFKSSGSDLKEETNRWLISSTNSNLGQRTDATKKKID